MSPRKAKDWPESWPKNRLLKLAADLSLKHANRQSVDSLRKIVDRKVSWRGKGKPPCYGISYDPGYYYPRSKFSPCSICILSKDCQETLERRYQRNLARRWANNASEHYRYRGKRLKRDLVLANTLKLLYDFRCQICRMRFADADGDPVIHVHHIKPLKGVGKKGDVAKNMLVVCPNHHLMLDLSKSGKINWTARHVQCGDETFHLKLFDQRHISAKSAPE